MPIYRTYYRSENVKSAVFKGFLGRFILCDFWDCQAVNYTSGLPENGIGWNY